MATKRSIAFTLLLAASLAAVPIVNNESGSVFSPESSLSKISPIILSPARASSITSRSWVDSIIKGVNIPGKIGFPIKGIINSLFGSN